MTGRPVLTDQERALSLYLDALFAPMREAEATAPVATLEVLPMTPASPAGALAPVTSEPDEASVEAADESSRREGKHGIEPGFQGDCLFAEHRSLRLALPMQSLAAILPAPAEYARLPGQAAWLHGVLRHRDQNVPVVSASLLMARDEAEASTDRKGNSHVVVLASGRWAVHLDHMIETRTVASPDCRLRQNRERLPWLAGFVSDGLASLIDIPALEQWLDDKVRGTDTAKETAGDSPSGR